MSWIDLSNMKWDMADKFFDTEKYAIIGDDEKFQLI